MDEDWKILIVDDEASVHSVTKLVLSDLEYEGRAISFYSAHSCSEAKKILSENTDIAVILLDVVMEKADDGLQLARYIREDLQNWLVRIILRTGQPGQAPEESIIIDYDINDYKEKSELTSKKLFTAVISSLRSFRDLSIIDANRKGLGIIIESSSNISKLQSMKEFASGVLSQLINLLHLNKNALYCKIAEDMYGELKKEELLYVLTAAGDFFDVIDEKLINVVDKNVSDKIMQAIGAEESCYTDKYSIVYFKSKLGSENVIYMEGNKELSHYDKELLNKFCTSISSTFDNIYLNNKIIKNLRESIVVVDESNSIVISNSNFAELFMNNVSNSNLNNLHQVINSCIDKFDSSEENTRIVNAIQNCESSVVKGELSLINPENRIFSVNIQPVYKNNKEIVGRVISFSDITEYKNLLNELNLKNVELEAKNKKLAEHSQVVGELAIVKERNRFARDMHDTLGHTMTLLISQLEIALMDSTENSTSVIDNIQHALKLSKSCMNDIRRSINGLVPKTLELNNLTAALESLASDTMRLGVANIELYIEGSTDYNSPFYSDVIYRVCQEAITNSVRHGKAKKITILLVFSIQYIKLFIFDNGGGCSNIQEGFGLTGMKQRVRSVNGIINFGSDAETGFNINVEIPLEVK